MDMHVEDPAADPLYAGHSRTREKILETAFMADLCRALWKQGCREVEVLRAEIDQRGYDLVVECRGIVRHIQLKSKHRNGKNDEFKIQSALGDKPSACAIVILYEPATLAIGPFLWFGDRQGSALPQIGQKLVKHSKGDKDGVKAQRPRLRMLALSRFEPLQTMDEVVTALFGAAAASSRTATAESLTTGASGPSSMASKAEGPNDAATMASASTWERQYRSD